MDILAPLRRLRYVCFAVEFDAGNSGAAVTIDFTNGQKQRVTLTAAAPIITVAPPPGVGHYQLRLIQDATGGREPDWAGISTGRWLGSASAPPVNTDPDGETIWNGYHDGTNWTQSLARVGAA